MARGLEMKPERSAQWSFKAQVRRIGVVVFAAAIGCASKPPVDPLAQAGATRFGSSAAFLTFEVPAEEAQPFRLAKSSPAGRRLAELLAPARHSEMRITVGGPSSESTKKAILEAFSHYQGEILGGLELVFVGEMIDAREVLQAAKPLLATVYFSPQPQTPRE